MNPNDAGESLPTVVRLYQLSSIAALESASFEQVWRAPTETLGDSLLAAEEFVLYPSERQRRRFERKPEASYLVGVAVFRRPTGTSWRSVVSLPLPASALRCLAEQEDPGGEAAPPPSPIVRFRLEDFAIRGALGFEASDAPSCEAGDLGCRSRASAERAGVVTESTEPPAPPVEAPTAPSPSGAP